MPTAKSEWAMITVTPLMLSPLLFIIVLEVLARDFRTCCPWELSADDLVILSDSTQDLTNSSLKAWKDHMEKKRLRVNTSKTKNMSSGKDLDTLKETGT